LADFRNREALRRREAEFSMKKPGRVSATGLCPGPKGPDLKLSG